MKPFALCISIGSLVVVSTAVGFHSQPLSCMQTTEL